MSTTTAVKGNSLGVQEQSKEEGILTVKNALIVGGVGVGVVAVAVFAGPAIVAAGTAAVGKGALAAKAAVAITTGFLGTLAKSVKALAKTSNISSPMPPPESQETGDGTEKKPVPHYANPIANAVVAVAAMGGGAYCYGKYKDADVKKYEADIRLRIEEEETKRAKYSADALIRSRQR